MSGGQGTTRQAITVGGMYDNPTTLLIDHNRRNVILVSQNAIAKFALRFRLMINTSVDVGT